MMRKYITLALAMIITATCISCGVVVSANDVDVPKPDILEVDFSKKSAEDLSGNGYEVMTIGNPSFTKTTEGSLAAALGYGSSFGITQQV